MNAACVDPLTDPRWGRFLSRRQSSAFHSPQWMRVLAETYGLKVQANVLFGADGDIQAGLPFCQIEDIKEKRIVILPFSDYCDPLLDDIGQWNSLIERLLREQCPITIRCLHNEVPLADSRFERYCRAKWHGLDLRPDLDTLWRGLESSARRAIRKARKSGVKVRIAQSKDDLRAFFEMHLGVRKYRYRLLAQPYRFFEHIWQQFVETNSGLIMLAVYQDEIIGGILFLEWQNTLYYKFNASSLAKRDVRPNDLMIWEGIKYGKTKGFTQLDFGLSDWEQDGLIRYKRKYTSEEKAISFLRHDSAGAARIENKQIQALFPQLTDLFTDESVPDAITENAGDILYRFFI